ncbi:hypothetical protein MMC30_007417 [Trapelia coarctata]|nr:hypothetical protein [Trapelia coarctata]
MCDTRALLKQLAAGAKKPETVKALEELDKRFTQLKDTNKALMADFDANAAARIAWNTEFNFRCTQHRVQYTARLFLWRVIAQTISLPTKVFEKEEHQELSIYQAFPPAEAERQLNNHLSGMETEREAHNEAQDHICDEMMARVQRYKVQCHALLHDFTAAILAGIESGINLS